MRRLFRGAVLALVGTGLLAVGAAADDAPVTRARAQGAPPSTAAVVAPLKPTPAAELTQYNPDAVKGVLPNGLRYTVMRRGGARQASILLHIDAGSVNESDQEQGVAHFLEHMAFNGSPAFPAETLPKRFAGIGVALGRDQNASTTVTGTTYRLDISEETDAKLDLSFLWLRDVADNLTIGEDQVERERGVVMSEYNASRGPMQALSEKSSGFLAPGALGAARPPIGRPEDLHSMTAARVRGFYERWYRPDNAIVIVVADAPVAELEARIKATFGAWTAPGPKTPKPNAGRIDPKRPGDVFVATDPHYPDGVQVCRGRDVDAKQAESVTTRVRDLEDVAWSMALKNRLERLANNGDPPFVTATVVAPELFDSIAYTCLAAYARDGDWKRAVKAISEETRRMELYGVTQQETRSALLEIKGMLDAGAGIADTQPAAALADIILRNYLSGGTFSTAKEDVRIGTLAMQRITPASVTQTFRNRWSKAGKPLVIVTSDTPVDTAQVRQAWAQAEAGPAPTALAERGELQWGYATFGPKGQVVERLMDDENDLVRSRFANGVKVTFKSTQNATDRVEVRIRFGRGQQDIPPEEMMTANLGGQMMQWGGLGKNTYDDTVTLCEGHLCEVGFGIDRESFLLSGTTRPSDLDTELQLLTAYLVDPGFRADLNPRIPSAVNAMNRYTSTDPSFQAQKARGQAMLKPHVSEFPDPGALAKVTAADFARLLKPVITTAPLEVTIIGDIDEATVMESLAKTLGAIPARPAQPAVAANPAKARYPAEPPVLRVTHEGAADKAVVLVTWPTFVFSPAKVHDGRVLDLLADVMQNEMLVSIRENLGATYSPQVNAEMSKGGDQGSLTAEIETTPATAEQVLSTIREIGARLASGDIDADSLERVRRPKLDRGGIRESTNEWWIGVLDGSWRNPDQLAAAATWQSDYEGVTLAEIKAAAKTWLSKPPMVVVATPAVGGATRVAGAPAPK